MPYTIALSDDEKYIISRIVGDLTNALAEKHNIEVHTKGKALGIDRFLVDLVESRYVQGPVQHYEFINSGKSMHEVLNRYARVAILVDADDHSHDFIETVARNAGHDLVIFRDREKAIQHLIHDL